ncbi:hypothetical protein QJS10_CPA16g00606 [Acorus calamus]|uniref:Uncharacterized protein n=1 Tax=Acorus calamus TaxID=4465 RepID=A0AAV9CXN9_ACOCL|nr:hypothetical protein QJS10_CPA16g00606 [Acorus calamus]
MSARYHAQLSKQSNTPSMVNLDENGSDTEPVNPIDGDHVDARYQGDIESDAESDQPIVEPCQLDFQTSDIEPDQPIAEPSYGDFNAFPRRLREGYQRTGVKLVDVPNGRKDASDKAILVDMFLFALDNQPHSQISLLQKPGEEYDDERIATDDDEEWEQSNNGHETDGARTASSFGDSD